MGDIHRFQRDMKIPIFPTDMAILDGVASDCRKRKGTDGGSGDVLVRAAEAVKKLKGGHIDAGEMERCLSNMQRAIAFGGSDNSVALPVSSALLNEMKSQMLQDGGLVTTGIQFSEDAFLDSYTEFQANLLVHRDLLEEVHILAAKLKRAIGKIPRTITDGSHHIKGQLASYMMKAMSESIMSTGESISTSNEIRSFFDLLQNVQTTAMALTASMGDEIYDTDSARKCVARLSTWAADGSIAEFIDLDVLGSMVAFLDENKCAKPSALIPLTPANVFDGQFMGVRNVVSFSVAHSAEDSARFEAFLREDSVRGAMLIATMMCKGEFVYVMACPPLVSTDRMIDIISGPAFNNRDAKKMDMVREFARFIDALVRAGFVVACDVNDIVMTRDYAITLHPRAYQKLRSVSSLVGKDIEPSDQVPHHPDKQWSICYNSVTVAWALEIMFFQRAPRAEDWYGNHTFPVKVQNTMADLIRKLAKPNDSTIGDDRIVKPNCDGILSKSVGVCSGKKHVGDGLGSTKADPLFLLEQWEEACQELMILPDVAQTNMDTGRIDDIEYVASMIAEGNDPNRCVYGFVDALGDGQGNGVSAQLTRVFFGMFLKHRFFTKGRTNVMLEPENGPCEECGATCKYHGKEVYYTALGRLMVGATFFGVLMPVELSLATIEQLRRAPSGPNTFTSEAHAIASCEEFSKYITSGDVVGEPIEEGGSVKYDHISTCVRKGELHVPGSLDMSKVTGASWGAHSRVMAPHIWSFLAEAADANLAATESLAQLIRSQMRGIGEEKIASVSYSTRAVMKKANAVWKLLYTNLPVRAVRTYMCSPSDFVDESAFRKVIRFQGFTSSMEEAILDLFAGKDKSEFRASFLASATGSRQIYPGVRIDIELGSPSLEGDIVLRACFKLVLLKQFPKLPNGQPDTELLMHMFNSVCVDSFHTR